MTTRAALQLWRAAEQGNTGEVVRLVAAGASVGSRDPKHVRMPPAAARSSARRTELTRCRVQADSQALRKAARRGHLATVQALARLGAEVDARDRVRTHACPSAYPRPPLCRRMSIMGRLLSLRCCGRCSDALRPRARQDGWTALMLAAEHGHATTVAELIRLGANVNERNNVRASMLRATPPPGPS